MTPRTVHEVIDMLRLDNLITKDAAAEAQQAYPDRPILQEGMVAVPEKTVDGLIALGHAMSTNGYEKTGRLMVADLSAAKAGK